MCRFRSPRDPGSYFMKQAQFIILALISLLVHGCPGTPGMSSNTSGERAVPDEGTQHLPVGTTATYLTNPPASGPHWSAPGVAPVMAGLYQEADGLRPEQWVHNLEHGYIVYLY